MRWHQRSTCSPRVLLARDTRPPRGLRGELRGVRGRGKDDGGARVKVPPPPCCTLHGGLGLGCNPSRLGLIEGGEGTAGGRVAHA